MIGFHPILLTVVFSRLFSGESFCLNWDFWDEGMSGIYMFVFIHFQIRCISVNWVRKCSLLMFVNDRVSPHLINGSPFRTKKIICATTKSEC